MDQSTRTDESMSEKRSIAHRFWISILKPDNEEPEPIQLHVYSVKEGTYSAILYGANMPKDVLVSESWPELLEIIRQKIGVGTIHGGAISEDQYTPQFLDKLRNFIPNSES